MTTIINIFGGPGVGKSTAAARLYATMKAVGFNVELVQEYAKELYYRGELNNTPELEIFSEQVSRLQTFERSRYTVDYVITDAPLLKNAIYAQTRDMGHFEWPAFVDYVRTVFDLYNNKNIFLMRNSSEYKTAGRAQSYREAMLLDASIEDELIASHHAYLPLRHPELITSPESFTFITGEKHE